MWLFSGYQALTILRKTGKCSLQKETWYLFFRWIYSKYLRRNKKSSLCWMKPISWFCWKISGFYIILKNDYSFSWLLLVLKYWGKIIAYLFRCITYANTIQNKFFHQVSMNTDFLSLITLTHFIFPLRTHFLKKTYVNFSSELAKEILGKIARSLTKHFTQQVKRV